MVLPFWLVLWWGGLQVAQTDLKLATYLELILNLWVLLPFLECWDCRHVPPYLVRDPFKAPHMS